ncbi:MAG: HD domain-containing protein [Syntrophales bacterium]|nr:HD domain-containing protein [Syntrophales bacterium]MDD5233931.1 HD domain-containing protein [Syntrophales bacterium]MDD5532081.1 HD domain-containing protein [Syntrophales bacterium]
MLTEKEKLEGLVNLGVELNHLKDLDILMERILREARRFVNADAGSIYLRDGEKLIFSYTQNDSLERKLPPGAKLIYSTFTLPIGHDSVAGFCAAAGEVLNIPDVYNLAGRAPYSFGRRFDEKTGYRSRSMLAVPLITVRNELIGVLQIINAQDDSLRIVPFTAMDEKIMLHFAATAAVALDRARLTRNIILRTIRMAGMRDPKETGAHVNRVAAYAVEIYDRWAVMKGVPRAEIEAKRDVLRMAAMVHDVGKVAISDSILKKPGKLTPEEYEIMKQHTVFGADLFRDKRSEFDDAAEDVSLNHHECWDGSGYPGILDDNGKRIRGRKGEEISLFGRIVAICDVYDALVSRRVYKEAWEESKALQIMREGSGKQFDPELIDAFFDSLDSIRQVRERYPELCD